MNTINESNTLKNGLTVLSLFDGISCGHIALDRAGIKVKTYLASEIKKHAINTTMLHYPDTIQIGDVTKVHYDSDTRTLYKNCEKEIIYDENGEFKECKWTLGKKVFEGNIDLLIGGSPCQNFSIARVSAGYERDGLEGDKSVLFYEYLRLKNEINPTLWLLENVKMKKEHEKELNGYLGTEGLHINSKLVSFQLRPRIYWTNIPGVEAPEDRDINFQDYKDTDPEYCRQFKVNRTPSRIKMWADGKGEGAYGHCKNVTYAEKVGCVTRKQDRCPNSGLIEFEDFCRYLTRREIEAAQTLPIGYTDNLSYLQMQDVCGDGWTVDVIAHIFSYIK